MKHKTKRREKLEIIDYIIRHSDEDFLKEELMELPIEELKEIKRELLSY